MNLLLTADTNQINAGITSFILIMWFVFMGIGLLSTIFWIIMLVDAAQRKQWQHDDDKTLWILVIALTGGVGALVYYFMIYRKLGKT